MKDLLKIEFLFLYKKLIYYMGDKGTKTIIKEGSINV